METGKNYVAFEIEDDLYDVEKEKEVEVAILPESLSAEGDLPMEKRLSYKFKVNYFVVASMLVLIYFSYFRP